MYADSMAFNTWAKEEGLCSSEKISVFAQVTDAKIAFDAEDYLYSILTGGQTTYEPLLPALGGIPFTLESHVDLLLENLQNAGMQPIFVFPGGGAMCRDRHTASRESRKALASLNEAWMIYNTGRGEEAVKEFGKACTYHTSHILRHLFFYLHRKGVQVMVAPYEPAAQLAHMLESKAVKAIVGSASCLVFGASQVIVDLDWSNKNNDQNGTFSWISRDFALKKLGFTQEQFMDLCLLSGCSILPALPEINGDNNGSRLNAAKVILNRSGRDGQAVCIQSGDEHYLNLYRKAKFAAKHMVVFHNGGEVKQMNFDTSPSDAHEFVGQRLPDELFNYTYRGLLSFRVLNWRTRQEIFETPPLDGGESAAYKELVQKKLTPLRARALALLTQSLHRYWHRTDVELRCWFHEEEKQPLNIPEMINAAKDADTWHVKAALMAQSSQVSQIDVTKTPLQFAVRLLSDEAQAKKTVTTKKDNEHSSLSQPREILANTLWRFLQDRAYINKDHTLSSWGKALNAAFERAGADGLLGKSTPVSEAEEAIFVAFEMIRLGVLNNKPIFPNPPYNERPTRGTDSDRANINLISRIATLGTFQHKRVGYTGPLSRTLLAFQQMASNVRDSLRDLLEVHACHLMTSGSAVRVRDYVEYTELGAQMPFLSHPDTGLAVMVRSHLDEQLNTGERTDIAKWFAIATDVPGDLQKVWKMWDAINTGVQSADSGIIDSEVKSMFSTADAWLKDKRRYVPLSNGVANS